MARTAQSLKKRNRRKLDAKLTASPPFDWKEWGNRFGATYLAKLTVDLIEYWLKKK